MKAALDEHSVDYRLDVWPGTAHGFSFAPREVYHHEASETCWTIFFRMMREELSGA